MRAQNLVSVIVVLGFGFPLSSQAAGVILGAEYSDLTHVRVAPGQVITIFAAGIGKDLSSRVLAGTVPLPRSLAGISVELRQSYPPGIVPLPIFSVTRLSSCLGSRCGSLTNPVAAITVQIPFELVVLPPESLAPPNEAVLVVSEGGTELAAVPVLGDFIRPHVINSCDTIMSVSLPLSTCAALVAHSDGSIVTERRPAKGGEVLTLYAVGLGQPGPLKTGEATDQAVPIPVAIDFEFEPNAAPRLPRSLATRPFYPGTAPGFVGLYQVNFQVPEVPPGTPSCHNSRTVSTNLTVSIGSGRSFSGAGVCVDVGDEQALAP